MRILVTGATGFVGAAVMRRLAAAGHATRALVRPGADRRNLAAVSPEIALGDLASGEGIDAAVAGCDALFHVAADYRLWVPDPDRMLATNVEGTRRLLAAAGRAGVGRIVYTSSVATLGHAADGAPADETTPVGLDDMVGIYKRSKYLAEAAVAEMARDGLPVVIVNPSTPVGPGDVKPTPTGRVIADAVAGRIPAYVDTGLNIVHVDDVADGHLLAFEKGKLGERYVLGGEDLSLKDILGIVAALCHRPPPRVRLPIGAVMPVAYAAEAWARLTGIRPIATVDELRMARHRMFFSSGKAKRELGYRPRPAAEALADAVAWFRAERTPAA